MVPALMAALGIVTALRLAGGPAPADSDELARRMGALLAEVREDGEDGEDGDAFVASELARLGPPAIPRMFEALATGRIVSAPPTPEVELDERGRTLLLDALCSFGREAILPPFQRDPPATRGERGAFLGVLGHVGNHRDLASALSAASPPRAGDDLRVEYADLLEETVERILRRDRQAFAYAGRLVLDAHPAVARALAQAIGDVPTHAGLHTLAGLLGFDPDLDALLLNEIGAIGQALAHPLDEGVLEEVRRYLGDQDPSLTREAALAVGRLEDCRAVGRLIGLLRSEERAVRENAYWSLQRISGLRFSPESRRWGLWFREERQWFETETPALFRDLRARELGRVVSALNALSAKRYRRDEIAHEIAALLDDDDDERILLACLALARLGSSAAVIPLIGCLEVPQEAVRAGAASAPASITGCDLPPEARLWRERFPEAYR